MSDEKDPFGGNNVDADGIDIDLDDDLDGWGEGDEEEEAQAEEVTDVTMSPSDPDPEEDQEDLLLMNPDGMFGDGSGATLEYQPPEEREHAPDSDGDMVEVTPQPMVVLGPEDESQEPAYGDDEGGLPEAVATTETVLPAEEMDAPFKTTPVPSLDWEMGEGDGEPAQAEAAPAPESADEGDFVMTADDVQSVQDAPTDFDDGQVSPVLPVDEGATQYDDFKPGEDSALVYADEVDEVYAGDAEAGAEDDDDDVDIDIDAEDEADVVPEAEPVAEAVPEAETEAEPEPEPESNTLDLSTIEPLPLEEEPPEGAGTWLSDFGAFRRESQTLARTGKWEQLAAITTHALHNAPYADKLTQVGLLQDLARMYRDRLSDMGRAEAAFRLVAQEEPANPEALTFLVDHYKAQADHRAIYDLYMAAVETTWDPNERLNWTREAADIGVAKIGDTGLAIAAWEHLWELGDAVDEASRELSGLYRRSGHWQELATFLEGNAAHHEGAARLVVLRELAEVKLSGLNDPDGASSVLEQIVELSPQDVIATLQLARVYAQRQDWDGMDRLGRESTLHEVAPEAALDLQHLVADNLWQAGKLDESVAFYDRILEVEPGDSLASACKQEYLTRTERHDELLTLLIAKADGTTDETQHVALLAQAAELAEKELGQPDQAAKLWERRIKLDPEHEASFAALVRLYETLGDLEGVARALDGQLALAKDTKGRIELMRQLGKHHADRVGDDEQAEHYWKEILALDPEDRGVRKELIELHRRRGNFEALNSGLVRQIWLTTDEERAVELCRTAAQNLDDNFDEPARSANAWRRILDFAPFDLGSLGALKKLYAQLDRREDLLAVMEQEIRALEEGDERVTRALELAKLWEEAEAPKAATAVYEVVLGWEPGNEQALERLLDIYVANDQLGKALGLLEWVGLREASPEDRARNLRHALELLPEDDQEGRFYLLRRILLLQPAGGGDQREVLDELKGAAEAADLWGEIPAVLSLLAAQTEDSDQRLALQQEMAAVWEEKLENADRAYLTLQQAFLSPERDGEVLEEALRLARATERFEDMLVLLDRMTTPDFDLDKRKAMIRQRAEIFEKDLEDIHRAMQERWRLLALDPEESEELDELERLADENDQWAPLDHLLTEMVDRAVEDEDRMGLMARRERLHREQLDDREGAFDLLVLQHRLTPGDLEVTQRLSADAEAANAWEWVLPLLEARALFHGGEVAAQALAVTADLYDEKLEDKSRAFHLSAAAFIQSPENAELADRLEGLSGEVDRHEALADVFRLAAAFSEEQECTVDLLRRIANIYEEKLEQPDRAIDIHTRLLYLKEDEVPSLEVMIAWHRERCEWRDLRDRMRQRIALSEDPEEIIPWLLEIAATSDDKLMDAEEALQAYGDVLEIDPQHDEARDGLEGLVQSISEPTLRLRWLEMQLKGAEDEKSEELLLEMAQIQEEELDDLEGATRTLVRLVSGQEVPGVGFDELVRMLRKARRWGELVEALRDRAAVEADVLNRDRLLDEAMALAREHLDPDNTELWHTLYQAYLTARPDDREVRTDQARLLRRTGRLEELCEELKDNLANTKDPWERVALRTELARIQEHSLDRAWEARKTWLALLEEVPEAEGASLALSRDALIREELGEYIDLRRRQARQLPPREGALVLCHLAEVAEENEAVQDRMVALYREARTVDPNNLPAMEALKGIGRRLKNLRPAAALLPEEGERDLSIEERASRLRDMGDEALIEGRLDKATDWYLRAVATNPDDESNWESLAEAHTRAGEGAEAFRANRGKMQLLERTRPLTREDLLTEAEALFVLARAAKAAVLPDEERYLVRRAYDLAPNYAPAALAMAKGLMAADEIERAQVMLHGVLTMQAEQLSKEQRTEALYARGKCLRKQGRDEDALSDIREVLSLQPLHPEALAMMGDMLAGSGRAAAAIEIKIRALTTVEDPLERAELYYHLGVLWEDGLEALEEAGVCYELALAEGLEQRDLLHRALRHLQRTGRPEQSLEVVDGLLPTAEDPEELATLWLVRGEIYATREGQEEEAVEAFDMALSYDPARQEARDGLTLVLEKQQDWGQLLQVLEASCDVGEPINQSRALQRMALISRDQLGDPDGAEDFLRRSVEVCPTEEALTELEQIYTEESGQLEQRKEILGLLSGFGPPWFDRCLELAKLLLEDDKPWAWCLLSPLLGVSQVDQDIKAVIQSMRKEFERPPILVAAGDDLALMRHEDADQTIGQVLAELDEQVRPLGNHSLDYTGDGNAIPIGEATTMGKAFGQVAEAMGIQGCNLYRTQGLDTSVTVVNSRPEPAVVVRTDVMQQLVHAEVGFLFAYVLELARPETRAMAAMSESERADLFSALWLVLEFRDGAPGSSAELVERIREEVGEELKLTWAEALEPYRDIDPVELSQVFWNGACTTALRTGLLAGADMRQVFRVLSRLDESVPRPRVVARVEELDQYVDSSDLLKDLVAFASSPSFGDLLRKSKPAGE